MTRQNALWLAIALPVTAMVWYPAYIGAAGIVGALVAIVALALPGARRQPPATIIRRLPTAYERGHSRWLPGIGIGISPRGGFHPFAFISLWRYRR